MKTVYLDSDFRCHVNPGDGLTPVETDFFDGKCDAYIEGYRFVPEGKVWTREDGKVFAGEMAAPIEDIRILKAYQRQYESTTVSAEELAELQEKAAAYDILTGGAE